MLSWILYVLGAVIALALGYTTWLILQVRQLTEERVRSSASIDSDAVTVCARLQGSERSYQIREIWFPRKFGEALGIECPDGFLEKPYTLEDVIEPHTEDSQAWVATTNAENFRWVGQIPFRPDQPVSITFPIQHWEEGQARVVFIYEGRVGISARQTTFYVDVGNVEHNNSLKADALKGAA